MYKYSISWLKADNKGRQDPGAVPGRSTIYAGSRFGTISGNRKARLSDGFPALARHYSTQPDVVDGPELGSIVTE